LFEIYAVTVNKGKADWEHFSWNVLPAKSQVSVREALTRLEDLAQGPDDRVAAGALEMLGILEGPILHEPNRCVSSLQRAVALQPSREQAWEVLVATLAQTRRYEELLAVCEDQVKQDDSARAHIMLAKAHERLKHWDDCEDEARLAVSEDPDDVVAGVALGAVLLKRSRDDAALLSEADDSLTRAESALKKTPPSRRNRQVVIDLTLTRGIYFALTGEIETARKWVQTVVDSDKDNQFAKEILSAMDF
jgi:tetratricopeptide (TPR) repeat protein